MERHLAGELQTPLLEEHRLRLRPVKEELRRCLDSAPEELDLDPSVPERVWSCVRASGVQ